MDKGIYLASQSPRRRELLEQIGVYYEVLRVSVPEQRGSDEPPQGYVSRLSRQKAAAGAELKPGTWVMGADTIVIAGEQVLEKPVDKADFLRMFSMLSGATHSVFTSVALCRQGENGIKSIQTICETKVQFRDVGEDEACRYWETGEPQDKAGGYGIQGLAAAFVESIEGSYSNVVGLPLCESVKLLAEVGVPIWNTDKQ